jgi:hypothetical protein
MDSFASAARVLAERVRYSKDMLRPKFEGDSASTDKIRNQFFHDGLLVSHSVTPDLANRLGLVCQRLQIPENAVEAFIYASPDIQAECFSGSVEKCVVRFSSTLVDLLNGDEFEFVVGHELGHFLLNHGVARLENQKISIESSIENRAQEISADRLGLVACHSLEVAIRAMMKTVSGLSSEHLRFDVGAFVSQLRSTPDTIQVESQFSSHPSILVRCRALLWFSLSDVSSRGVEQFSIDQLAKVDSRVEKDMDKFVDGPAKRLIEDAKENLAIWVAANYAVQDGVFNKNEQKKFSDMFGELVLKKLKIFLSDIPASEVQETVYERVRAAREDLEQLIPSGLEDSVREIQKMIEVKLA